MILDIVKIEGNVLTIRSNPTTGIIALTSFADDSSGTNITGKNFRYSKNGITFTDWQPLIVANILAISVVASDLLIIEIQYKKDIADPTPISATEATIGTTTATLTDTDLFKNSIFYQFFGSNDVEVLNWMVNVLDKLFQKGLIANYIERYNDFYSPEDFIEFWGSVCKFFAYYVIYARKYQKFYEDEILLAEYLEERGLKVSKNNTLSELQEMMKKYNREVARRGTIHIIDRDGVNGNVFDGELLRLINFIEGDEFLFNPNLPEHAGWNIGNSSPMYRSLTIHDNLNKFYEKGEQPVDITKYPIQGTVNIVNDAAIGKNVLSIAADSGIGSNAAFKIAVDPYLDYELSFYLKKSDGDNLTVGFDAYDQDGTVVNLLSRIDGSVLNNFFVSKNLQRSDKYIYCRFFLYSKLKPLYSHDGLNLKMVDTVQYVVPKILIGTGTASIYNIRFLPMAASYSKGFVQVNNFIDCFLKNNNNQYDLLDIYNYIRKYLIPYSSHIKILETNKAGDYSLETYIAPDTYPSAPTITTNAPSNITSSSATLGGTITSDGGLEINEKGIVWSTSVNPTIANNRVAIGRGGTGSFSKSVSGLPSGTTIYVKAYAINAQGITYGNELSMAGAVVVNSINITNANPSNAGSIQFTAIFSTVITGLTAANFSLVTTGGVAGASITGITGSGTTYVITVDTGTGDGTIGLNLANDTGLNHTITNKPYTGQNYLIDKTAPTATITAHPSSVINNNYTGFSFSGTDTGGSGLAGFLVSMDGGAFTSDSSPKNYIGLSNGSHTFQVKAVDNAGNVGSAATYTFTVDTVAPSVTSINRQTPSTDTINTADTSAVTFRVTFSEDVTGVDTTDFLLLRTGTADGSISSVTQVSGSIYDVLVNGVIGNGTLRLDLRASGTGIQDAVGNTASGAYTSGQVYTISTVLTDVTISLVPRVDTIGSVVNFYVTAHADHVVDRTSGITVAISYNINGGAETLGVSLTIDSGSTDSSEAYVDSGTTGDSINYTIVSVIPTSSSDQNYIW
jgi:hypothetical protein